jgi:putative FmdB family regulatory protein
MLTFHGFHISLYRMPTYEYRCPSGHEFERFYRKISDAAPGVTCPDCGKVAERIMSVGGGFAFKGSGFYLTDYGKNAHRGGAAPKADGAGGDAAPSGDSSSTTKESSSSESTSGSKETSPPATEKSASKESGSSAKSGSGGESKPATTGKPAESKSSSESQPKKSGGSKRSNDK